MAALNTTPEPVHHSPADGIVAGQPVQTPMCQQSLLGSHGYDMHPQEFVRLSGCQEHRLPKKEAA